MTHKPGTFLNLFVSQINSYEVTLEDSNHNKFNMPATEQTHQLSIGSEVLVVLYSDGNLWASMRLEKHANHDLSNYSANDEVELYIIKETPLGYKCIIDGQKIGMLYKNEVFKPLPEGTQTKGYISKIRDDHKIDLLLLAPGHKAAASISDQILAEIKKSNGFLPITDKTDPEKIYQLFGVSKKKFKIALGALYKSRKIEITDEGIRLV